MSRHFAGQLLGRRARITFPKSIVECRYSLTGTMSWTVQCKEKGTTTQGSESLSYLQLSEQLHFLNWEEKTGHTVSQVIDTQAGTVRALWSHPDEKQPDHSRVFGDFSLL